MIFILFGVTILVALLKHWGILPTPILKWRYPDIDGLLFMFAGGLFVLAILIFAPLYRRFGKDDKSKGVAKFLYGTKNNKKG